MHMKSLAWTFFAMSLAGCAIHPLPENYTELDTNHIVFYIRCQARDAINQSAGAYLVKAPDDYTSKFGQSLLDRHKTLSEIDQSKANLNAIFFIKKYLPAAIAYDFTFDMTEENDVSAGADFLNTFTRGTFSLGISAADNRKRQTTRNFRISDTFAELTGKTTYCGQPRTEPNWSYPITGNIGLEEVVKTFINLNEHENLAGKDDKDTAPVLSDTLDFQTTLSGTAAPKVTLTPLGRGVTRLSDASLGGSASRKDDHKVIVALSLAPKKSVSTKDLTTLAMGGSLTLNSLAFDKSPAEKIAIAEIANQVERQIITALSSQGTQ